MKMIDGWIEDGWIWGQPISHEVYLDAKNGKWNVVLTPTKPVPHEWFGELKGKKLLGLASGGGQQMPIFCAAGAQCTVFDYSQRQTESERMVAEREGYDIRIVRGDMTKPLPFEDGEFDIIFHPVSNSFVEDVMPIWRECARVLKKGGILLAGLDNGINFAYSEDETRMENVLPFNPLRNEKQCEQIRQEGTTGYEFSHTIEEQIGGQLKVGFKLVDIFGDTNGYGILHEHNIQTFYATKSIKE